MLTKYDPDHSPDPARWLGQDEMQLIDIVERYHTREQVPLLNPRQHAALHVMVENQVALGDNGKLLIVGAPFDPSNATGFDGDRDDDSALNRGAVWIY